MEGMYNTEDVQINPTELDEALKHFNWGAFFFAWLWGLGNGSFSKTWSIILLDIIGSFISSSIKGVGIIYLICALGLRIYYGLNGNKWAYENRAWFSISDYAETQKKWAIFASVLMVIFVIFIITIFSAIIAMFSLTHK